MTFPKSTGLIPPERRYIPDFAVHGEVRTPPNRRRHASKTSDNSDDEKWSHIVSPIAKHVEKGLYVDRERRMQNWINWQPNKRAISPDPYIWDEEIHYDEEENDDEESLVDDPIDEASVTWSDPMFPLSSKPDTRRSLRSVGIFNMKEPDHDDSPAVLASTEDDDVPMETSNVKSNTDNVPKDLCHDPTHRVIIKVHRDDRLVEPQFLHPFLMEEICDMAPRDRTSSQVYLIRKVSFRMLMELIEQRRYGLDNMDEVFVMRRNGTREMVEDGARLREAIRREYIGEGNLIVNLTLRSVSVRSPKSDFLEPDEYSVLYKGHHDLQVQQLTASNPKPALAPTAIPTAAGTKRKRALGDDGDSERHETEETHRLGETASVVGDPQYGISIWPSSKYSDSDEGENDDDDDEQHWDGDDEFHPSPTEDDYNNDDEDDDEEAYAV